MPFVKRDESGAISAIYDRRERQIGEELAADHPEISEFLERLGRTAPIRENLDSSDSAMGRVLEDLIRNTEWQLSWTSSGANLGASGPMQHSLGFGRS